MSLRSFRLALIYWLLAPVALWRRTRQRPPGWVDAVPEQRPQGR